MQRQRIDNAADILNRNVIEQCNVAGLRVNSDIRGVSTVGVGSLVAGKSAVGRQTCKFSQVDRDAARSHGCVALDRDVVRRTVQTQARRLAYVFTQLAGGG